MKITDLKFLLDAFKEIPNTEKFLAFLVLLVFILLVIFIMNFKKKNSDSFENAKVEETEVEIGDSLEKEDNSYLKKNNSNFKNAKIKK